MKTEKRLSLRKIAKGISDTRLHNERGAFFDKGSLRFCSGEVRSVDAQHIVTGLLYATVYRFTYASSA